MSPPLTTRALVHALDRVVDFCKIGLSLQLASGAEALVHSLIGDGKRVFLDYKYYDIPATPFWPELTIW